MARMQAEYASFLGLVLCSCIAIFVVQPMTASYYPDDIYVTHIESSQLNHSLDARKTVIKMATLEPQMMATLEQKEVASVSQMQAPIEETHFAGDDSMEVKLPFPRRVLKECRRLSFPRRAKRAQVSKEALRHELPIDLQPSCRDRILGADNTTSHQWNVLDESLCRHRYVLVSGIHRSGTSMLHYLLQTLDYTSGFHDTGVPEDEGQWLQNEFPPSSIFGQACDAYDTPQAYMNATYKHVIDPTYVDVDLNQKNNTHKLRNCLHFMWSKYWDLSQPILLEKSPLSLTQFGFREALYPDVTAAMVSIRHPLYTCFVRRYGQMNGKKLGDVLELALKGWLRVHKYLQHTIRTDFRLKNRIYVLMFEDFYRSHPDPLQTLEEQIHIFFPELQQMRQNRRRLIYRGNDTDRPTIDASLVFQWVDKFERWNHAYHKRYVDIVVPLLEEFEEAVSEFGYSLLNVTKVNATQFALAFAPE